MRLFCSMTKTEDGASNVSRKYDASQVNDSEDQIIPRYLVISSMRIETVNVVVIRL